MHIIYYYAYMMTLSDDGNEVNLLKNYNAGSIIYNPGGSYGPRIQQDFQIIIIKRGSLNLNLNDRQLSLSSDENLLLSPGNNEFFQFDKTIHTEHMWLTLSFEVFNKDLINLDLACPLIVPHMKELELILNMILYLQENNPDAIKTIENLAIAALNLFNVVSRPVSKRNEPIWMNNVLNHIRTAYQFNSLSLDDLAKTAGMSSGHFKREFKKHKGISPGKYMWQYRKDKALNLLKYSGWKIYEIAEQTGFESVYHFSRVIKEYSGYSPLEYRKRYWSQTDM
jgi:AraC-like DNA-binding protein